MNITTYKNLMKLAKDFERVLSLALPNQDDRKSYSVVSQTTKDTFTLDFSRSGRIELKFTNHFRLNANDVPLVRLDINSPPHTNPDGRTLSRNHIHIRTHDDDGDGLPWAYEITEILPNVDISSFGNVLYMFTQFCEYCNITNLPKNMQGVL